MSTPKAQNCDKAPCDMVPWHSLFTQLAIAGVEMRGLQCLAAHYPITSISTPSTMPWTRQVFWPARSSALLGFFFPTSPSKSWDRARRSSDGSSRSHQHAWWWCGKLVRALAHRRHRGGAPLCASPTNSTSGDQHYAVPKLRADTDPLSIMRFWVKRIIDSTYTVLQQV